MLYKDIFFTNFPFLPYFSTIYFFFLQGNLLLYFATALLEAAGVGSLIYILVYQKTKNITYACLSTFLYLFSFIVLSTSDHQTGIFLASLFAVGSYYCLEKKHLVLAGMLSALCILTKAYFIPIPISFFVFLLLQKQYKPLMSFFLGGLSMGSIILLPFFLFSQKEFLHDVFYYSLTRGAGLDKKEIAWFFITHDVLLFFIFLFNLCTGKKNLLFALISFFSLLFFLFYQDIYYLYLNFLIPFLCISAYACFQWIQEKMQFQTMVIPTIIIFVLLWNSIMYNTSYRDLQKIPDITAITTLITSKKSSVLYGTNDIAPALSYTTNIPLLGNIVDTNQNIFRKKFLNATILTKNAISQKAIIVTHGAFYPTFGIQEDIMDDIFDKALMEKHCTLLQRFPVQSEGVINRINIFICQ